MKEYHKQWVSLLKGAQLLIDTNQCRFVCQAIDHAFYNERYNVYLNISLNACDALFEEISDRLGGALTVSQWLSKQNIPPELLTSDAMREYRLRWIDNMIKEFDA